MKKSVVILNGTGGCGKDTFKGFVGEIVKTDQRSSIDKVKEVATMAGWNGGKTEKDRRFLSDLKALTTAYNDLAFNDLKEKVECFKNSDNEILFVDIREPENIKRAVDEFDAVTVLIRRVGLAPILSNASDAAVENYDYDYVIENDSLEEFRNEAKRFVEQLNADSKVKTLTK